MGRSSADGGGGRPLWRDPILLGLLAVGVGSTLWYLSGLGDVHLRIQVMWLLFLPLDLLLVVLAWRVRSVPGTPEPARRFWAVLSVAAVFFTAGDVVHAVPTVREPRPEAVAGGTAQSVLFMLGLAALTFVMLRYPLSAGTGRERLRVWLDSITVLVGGAVLTWCFAVDPAVGSGDLVTALVGAAIALVTLFAGVRMALSGAAPVSQLAAAPMIVAMLLQVLAGYVTPTHPAAALSAGVFLTRLLPSVLVPAGPRIQELQARASSGTPRRRRQRPYSALPYVSIVATFAALIIILPEGMDTRLWGVVIGVVVITALVVARQLLAFHDNAGLINRLDGALLDLREHEKLLRHQAAHDGLTRLLNRAAFGERVSAELRQPEPDVALLLVDLDDFKTVNDTLGHSIGDALLIEVADRLRAAVRPDDVVARLGGDEFAILLRGVPGGQVDVPARRVLAALAAPFVIAGRTPVVHASIGAAVAGPGDDLVALLHNADIALYEAKDRGKNCYVRYAADLGARVFAAAELGARLGDAFTDEEFHLVYQPIVRLDNGRTVGTEALLRWHRPGLGRMPAAEFVAAAERTGLIVPLGRRVLREACRQAAAWLCSHGADAPQWISVNISGRQLREPGFVDEVAAALADAGLPADRLTLDLTEAAALANEEAAAALHAVRGLGVGIALDHYGTDASSLGRLAGSAVTALKLDRSFVDRITVDGRRAAVATAVAHVARTFHLDLVASGVETPEQADMLRRLGYEQAQGYAFARPALPDDLPRLWTPAGAAERAAIGA